MSPTARWLQDAALALLSLSAVGARAQSPTPALIEPEELPAATQESSPEGASALGPGVSESATLDESDPIADLVEALSSQHPWARHEPGAWRRLRVVSEAFDDRGDFVGQSLTEKTERLVAVDAETYTLAIETSVTLAGRQTAGPSEQRQVSFLTERAIGLGSASVARGEPTSISLGGFATPCQTWLVEIASPAGVERQTLYVGDATTPRLLRRETQSFVDDEPGVRRVASVTRRNTPTSYGDRLTDSWHVATTTEHPNGSRTERLEVCGVDVPGGLFQESVTEYGAGGERTRWAVTDLLAAGKNAAESVGLPAKSGDPAISIEIRPRRLQRLLRREERANGDL